MIMSRDLESVSVMNYSYIIPQNACGRRAPIGRALFYDLGCGFNAGATFNVTRAADKVFPGSLQLFTDLFERNCITFDRIFAWEYKAYNAAAWWGPLPVEQRAKITFFNMGVPPEPAEGRARGDSFIRLLNSTARPEDYVAVKLDIDTPGIEISIIHALLNDAYLASLVDELFFEYHFYEAHWYPGWFFTREQLRSGTIPNVDDALELMQRLRRMGIRAHFWV